MNKKMMKFIGEKLFKPNKFYNKILLNKYSNGINVDKKLHIPVMLDEVIKYLVDDVPEFKIYLDLTFGAGGHTEKILEKNPNSIVYASDRDPFAFELAKKMSLKYPGRLIPINSKFSDIGEILSKEKGLALSSIDAALIDCGCSSIQLDEANRGFSLSREGPLDMRMGSINEQTVSAFDVVNKLDEESLGKIIWKYGEERLYKKIAHGIVYFRSAHGPIQTTKQLADVIDSTVRDVRYDSLSRPTHIATKTFQAIRIFVNNELNELYNGINQVYQLLRPGGRLAVISFHSLEDRIVKSHFNNVDLSILYDDGDEKSSYQDPPSKSQLSKDKFRERKVKFKLNREFEDLNDYTKNVKKYWTALNNRKVILPSEEEIKQNSRARSAKLRVAYKN